MAGRTQGLAGVPRNLWGNWGRVILPAENELPDLPPYSLDVQGMDLGPETNAVGLELIETESREPVQGEEGAAIWAAAFPALAGKEVWVLDFFSHLDRVLEYCRNHK